MATRWCGECEACVEVEASELPVCECPNKNAPAWTFHFYECPVFEAGKREKKR